MKEHPIIMSGNHPKLILDGTKSMTRRVLRPQPDLGLDKCERYSHIDVGNYHPTLIDKDGEMYPGDEIFGAYTDDGEWVWKCPYGQVGDRLIIKETWATENRYNHLKPSEVPQTAKIWYLADGQYNPQIMGKVRSARFMCRWMSRLTPPITEVRVEKVQEITFEDCLAEGLFALPPDMIAEFGKDWQPPQANGKEPVDELADDLESETKHIFSKLWDSLNAKRGYSWEVNPWVWVISFKLIK